MNNRQAFYIREAVVILVIGAIFFLILFA